LKRRTAPLAGFAFTQFSGAILRFCGERGQPLATLHSNRGNLASQIVRKVLAKVWCWPYLQDCKALHGFRDRNAGFRMDFLLLSPGLGSRLPASGVDAEHRGRE
jgi:hypothetical protein